VRGKPSVFGFRFSVLGLFVLGCSKATPPVTSVQKQEVFERLVPIIDAKISGVTDTGFDILLANRFEIDGEEKLLLNRVHVEWPLEIPEFTSWDRVTEIHTDRFRSGNTEIRFDWKPLPGQKEPFNVVRFTLTTPKEFKITPRTVKSPGEIEWVFLAEQERGGMITRTWVGRIALPPRATAPDHGYWAPAQSIPRVPGVQVTGPVEDQKFVESTVTNLSFATSRPYLQVADQGFAPFGLNNDLYFGHTFWDMDVWVLPSMLFLQPEAVRQMNKYRLDRAAQAEKNAAEFFKKPNTGMMFPWESSVTGKETVRASSVKEHHISGSVLWGLNMSEKAGVASPAAVGKVTIGVGKFFENRSNVGPAGREINDVMSPDENHIGDNDLYTNLLAQWAMNGRKWEGPAKFKLPKDETSFLTYDNDKLRSYKQAAAVLSIFPLQYPEAEKQARAMMERFESKVSKNGPAMSDAIHATIWARLGEKQKAYDAWKRAWEPFVKGPQMMFSEKRSSERTYFYTGAAGCLNTVLYGFAGFRLDEKPLEGAPWKKQLKSGWWLSCKPCLPPKWKSLTISPMIIDGQKFSVEITPEKVNIQPAAGS